METAQPQQHALTARLALWSAHHRKRIALAWLLIVVAAIGACIVAPANTDLKQESPGEAGAAAKLIEQRFGAAQQERQQEIVVFSSSTKSVDDPSYKSKVQGLITDLRGLRATKTQTLGGTKVVMNKRVVGNTLTHYDVGLPADQSPFVSRQDPGVTFALVDMQGDLTTAKDNVSQVTKAVEASNSSDGISVVSGGGASVAQQSDDVVQSDLSRSLILNLVFTVVILIIVFRALVAAVVPLSLAFAAVITATGILSLISQSFALSPVYTEIVLLMGLATGIDYALFVISRYRREKRAGKSKEDALAAAAATSGKAVVFAGTTVVLAVCGMFLVGDNTFTSLGLSAVIVVVLAVVISVTLLPSLIALLGDNLDRLTPPFLRASEESEHGGVWGWIADRVLAHPGTFATVTVIVLLALAAPVLTLNLGFNGAKSLPDAVKAKKALVELQTSFTLGLTSPAVAVVDAGHDKNVFAPDVQSHVTQLQDLVEAETVSAQNPDAAYGSPIQTRNNDAGDTELVDIPINADTGEQKAIDAVDRLRNSLVPAAFGDSPAKVQVTGATAANIDFKDNIIFRTPIVFAFVLGLAFIILLVTFRSLVVAVKALLLNILSVGATYGLLVLVFQRGWLFENVLNFQATGIIESWLPLFLFAILFGLSMDYHMFVLGRIKEAHESGYPSDQAVAIGIKATAGTITSAAAIMVVVAIIFAFAHDIGIKQFGFGLAAAILIDATVIRSILLPASMKLLGDANWYLPKWLNWLPEIKMAE